MLDGKLAELKRKRKLCRHVPFEMRSTLLEMLDTEPNLRPSASRALQVSRAQMSCSSGPWRDHHLIMISVSCWIRVAAAAAAALPGQPARPATYTCALSTGPLYHAFMISVVKINKPGWHANRPNCCFSSEQHLRRPVELCKSNEDTLRHLRSSLSYMDARWLVARPTLTGTSNINNVNHQSEAHRKRINYFRKVTSTLANRDLGAQRRPKSVSL